MKRIFPLSTTLLLSSCFIGDSEMPYGRLSLPKLKQKASFLEKRLKKAESEALRAHEEVCRIEEEQKVVRMCLIRSEAEGVQNALKDPKKREIFKSLDSSLLFYNERELLYELALHSAPEIASEAEDILTTILGIITEISDLED